MDFTDIILLLVMILHIGICPFTKVEESFNLQAIHDVIYHRSNISQYDHLEFPGVVPRSFLGPLVVSGGVISVEFLKKNIFSMLGIFSNNKFAVQITARVVLGTLVFTGLYSYKRSVGRVFGTVTSRWLTLIMASQFHFLFYMSRPLPNVFALALVLHALAGWLCTHHSSFIWYSAFSIIIFRAELALFLGIILLTELVSRRLSVGTLLWHAVPAGIIALGLTVLVDSWFWQHWLWPEGDVLWYNTVLNKSSNWGTSPFLWYFYSALPRSLLASLPLMLLGLIVVPKGNLFLALPPLAFVFLYSFLPHKELRFIIYTIPVFNTVAALVMNRLFQNRRKSVFHGLVALCAVSHLVVNSISTIALIYISLYNYPGGEAIMKLQQTESPFKEVNVHLDVLACQTGISRFTQLNTNWRYNKTEDLDVQLLGHEFTHLITEATDGAHVPALYQTSHRLVATISAYNGLQYLGTTNWPPISLKLLPKLVILEKIINN